MSSVKKAVEIIGGQTKLANQINLRQSHVWKWINVNKQAPAKYIRKVSELTNGEITVEQLLADHEANIEKDINQ